MRTDPREAFRAGARALGSWVKLPTLESVEILALAGLDFIVVDLEHSPIDLSTAYGQIALADALGVCPLVRVPDHAPSTIQKVLDCGAAGVLVPRVDSLDEASAVASAFCFPPRGHRGSGGTSRAGQWGRSPRETYLGGGRTKAQLILQIESQRAVDDAAAMLAIDSVSGVLVGTADLALSSGTSAHDPTIRRAIADVRDKATAAGKIFGLACDSSPSAVKAALEDGADFVVCSNDASLLAEAAGAMVAALHHLADDN